MCAVKVYKPSGISLSHRSPFQQAQPKAIGQRCICLKNTLEGVAIRVTRRPISHGTEDKGTVLPQRHVGSARCHPEFSSVGLG